MVSYCAGYLAQGLSIEEATKAAQEKMLPTLEQAYSLGDGQLFPKRWHD